MKNISLSFFFFRNCALKDAGLRDITRGPDASAPPEVTVTELNDAFQALDDVAEMTDSSSVFHYNVTDLQICPL